MKGLPICVWKICPFVFKRTIVSFNWTLRNGSKTVSINHPGVLNPEGKAALYCSLRTISSIPDYQEIFEVHAYKLLHFRKAQNDLL